MAFDDRTREAFLAVVTHGSVGRAADALGMSQPTLSRMIKRLEQRLRVPLFDRFASGVTLTTYGEALLPFANRIESETSHALDEIERIRTGAVGVLRIGSAPSAGGMMLPDLFRKMLEQNPQLRIEMLEGVQDVLEPALLNRKVDVVIATEFSEKQEILKLDYSFHDYATVLASTSHPIRNRDYVSLKDLGDYPWVLPPAGTYPRRNFESRFQQFGVSAPPVAVETWSVSMMKALVADSHFLSWLPHSLFQVEERAGLIGDLLIEGLTFSMSTHVFRRARGLVPPAVRQFLDLLRKTMPAATT